MIDSTSPKATRNPAQNCVNSMESVLVSSHMYPSKDNPITGIFVHEQVKAAIERGQDIHVITGTPFWISLRPFHAIPFNILKILANHDKLMGPKTEIYDGVPVTRFRYPISAIFPSSLHTLPYIWAANNTIKKILGKFQFDLIHAHTALLDGNVAVRAGMKYKVPVIITEHTGPFTTLTNTFLKSLQTSFAINNADAVICVSNYLRDQVNNNINVINKDKVVVIGNGVNTDLFHPNRSSFAEGKSTTNILWVGHHEQVKQVPVLLEAFANAWLRNPNLQLTLVGGGLGLEDSVNIITQLNCEKAINILPYLNRRDLAALFRQHDFFVVSSKQETFCVSAIEALSSGLPVVSTACGGPEDFISNPNLGIIVANNSMALTEGILLMANRISGVDKIKIHNHIKNNYSFGVVCDKLNKIYKKYIYLYNKK